MRPPKAKPLAGAIRAEGFHQSTEQGSSDSASLGTEEANEARIRELRAGMDAAAAAGDVATYKQHQTEYIQALSAGSPEQIHRLNKQHLAAVERMVALGDNGQRYVPASWLESDTGRAVAWRTSRPLTDEADARRSA